MTSIGLKIAPTGLLALLLLASGGANSQAQDGVSEAASDPRNRSTFIEPGARFWKTWLLASARELRLNPPPQFSVTRAELETVRGLVAGRTDADLARIRYWDAGPPSNRWVEIALAQFFSKPISNPRILRGMSLMNVAIYDATVAAWDTKYFYSRKRPAVLDPTLDTAAATLDSPSYPSEHAVVAGAASEILAYIYPDDAQTFRDKAQEDADSRVLAGVQYPTDSVAGLALGRAVAARVIERAKSDGSDAVWTGTVPSGPGLWSGTNPIEPLAGTWKTWVLTSGDQFRPGPPPAFDSSEEATELAEVKNFQRTFASTSKAFYWQTPLGLAQEWYNTAVKRIFEHHLDKNQPRTARIFAMMSIAHYDAIIACFDAKYAYWAIRPFQLDPTIVTLFPTPNHPSYPSAHAAVSTAITEALAYAFPDEAAAIRARALEAGEARLWAGIHFRSDLNAGFALGKSVADAVIARFQNDGSQ
jgi:membrane-associated phospholipid phosphatase